MRASMFFSFLALGLAACVEGNPAEPSREVPAGSAFMSAQGDTLRLFGDGTFHAKVGQGVDGGVKFNGQTIRFWIVGTYTRSGSTICARPNYFDQFAPHCGAEMASGVINDPASVFLWDQVPRAWQTK